MSKKRIVDGDGYSYAQGPWGFSLDIDQPSRVVTAYPFRVTTFKDGSVMKARVMPGTANNFVPKISGTYLDADTPPTLTLSSGKNLICLKVTYSTATFFPDTVEVVALTSDAAMAPTNSNGYLQLASVNVTGSGSTLGAVVYQYIFASQVVVRAKPGSTTAVWAFSSR